MKIKSKRDFLIAVLRRASYKWPPRNEALKKARVSRGKYRCNICKNIFTRKAIAIDHINPVIPITGWDSLDNFAERLFCDVDGLQVLCNIGKESCHKIKTKKENALRKEHEKKNV